MLHIRVMGVFWFNFSSSKLPNNHTNKIFSVSAILHEPSKISQTENKNSCHGQEKCSIDRQKVKQGVREAFWLHINFVFDLKCRIVYFQNKLIGQSQSICFMSVVILKLITTGSLACLFWWCSVLVERGCWLIPPKLCHL